MCFLSDFQKQPLTTSSFDLKNVYKVSWIIAHQSWKNAGMQGRFHINSSQRFHGLESEVNRFTATEKLSFDSTPSKKFSCYRNFCDWCTAVAVALNAAGVKEQPLLACSQLNYQSHFHINPPPRRENQFGPNNSSRGREMATLNIMRLTVMAAEGEFRLHDADRIIWFCLSQAAVAARRSKHGKQTGWCHHWFLFDCFYFGGADGPGDGHSNRRLCSGRVQRGEKQNWQEGGCFQLPEKRKRIGTPPQKKKIWLWLFHGVWIFQRSTPGPRKWKQNSIKGKRKRIVRRIKNTFHWSPCNKQESNKTLETSSTCCNQTKSACVSYVSKITILSIEEVWG